MKITQFIEELLNIKLTPTQVIMIESFSRTYSKSRDFSCSEKDISINNENNLGRFGGSER